MLDRLGFLDDNDPGAWGAMGPGADPTSFPDAEDDSNPFGGPTEGAAPPFSEAAAAGGPTEGGGDEVLDVDDTYDDLAMEKVDAIKSGIEALEGNVEKITEHQKTAHDAVDNTTIQEGMGEVDQITQESIRMATETRKQIEELRIQNAEFAGTKETNSTKVMWRKNQLRTLSKQLRAATGHVTAAAAEFQRTVQQRQVRQMCIVSDFGEEEKEEIMRKAEADPVAMQMEIMQRIEQFGVSKETLDRIEELENQNDKMKNIEKSVQQIQQMFEQLAQMVVDQGEMLDEIEQNVQNTKDFVAQAKVQIIKAAEHKSSARKKKFLWMMCCLAMIIVLIVVFLV